MRALAKRRRPRFIFYAVEDKGQERLIIEKNGRKSPKQISCHFEFSAVMARKISSSFFSSPAIDSRWRGGGEKIVNKLCIFPYLHKFYKNYAVIQFHHQRKWNGQKQIKKSVLSAFALSLSLAFRLCINKYIILLACFSLFHRLLHSTHRERES